MEKESADEKNTSWDNLDRHRDPPACCRRVVHVLVDPVVYPEPDETAHLVGDFEKPC